MHEVVSRLLKLVYHIVGCNKGTPYGDLRKTMLLFFLIHEGLLRPII